MKMMLKLNVLSLMFAVTLSAAPSGAHLGKELSGQPSGQPIATDATSDSQAAELLDKVNVCIKERGGEKVELPDVSRASKK